MEQRKASDVALWRWAFGGLVLALALAGGLRIWEIATAPPPNLLLISIDTLRADHLGCYGYPHPTSPNIDLAAAQGVVVERCISPRGLTLPALATLLTGMETYHHKVRYNYHNPKGLVTLGHVFRDRGYLCRAYLANADVYAQHGFDSDSRGVTKDFPYDQVRRDREITAFGVDFLKERRANSKKPFFLWLHYMNPHRPYIPPDPWAQGLARKNTRSAAFYNSHLEHYMADREDLSDGRLREIVDYYDACTAFTDSLVGQVLQTLREQKLEENTLVVITSDHGEELYEHLHYFLHQVSTYDGTLHVPLIFLWKGTLPAGVRIPESVGLLNVAPTLDELLGGKGNWNVDGISFRDLLQTYADADNSSEADSIRRTWTERPIFIEMVRPEGNAYGVYRHPYKYVMYCYNPDETGFITQPVPVSGRRTARITYPPEELFDLAGDPGEIHNLVETLPAVRHQLKGLVKQTLDQYPEWQEVDVSVIDEEGRKTLEAMGYLTGDAASRSGSAAICP